MLLVTFSYFTAPICRKDVTPTKEVTIEEVYEYIRGDAAKDRTVHLRTLTDKKERNKSKRDSLDYATFSGTFSNRREDGLIRHSGLICLDIDHIGPTEQVEMMKIKVAADNDIPVVLAFTSPSGDGMKIVVKADIQTPSDHKTAFIALADFFKQKYGLPVDPSGKDVCRACFLPYDPNAILRTEDRPAFNFALPRCPMLPEAHGLSTRESVEVIIQKLQEQHIDITDQYDDWLHAGLGLAHEFGEEGRAYFHRISAMSAKYDAVECDKKYNNLLRTHTGQIGIGTFFLLARQAGIDSQSPQQHKKNIVAQIAQTAHVVLPQKSDNAPEAEERKLPTLYSDVEQYLPTILRRCTEGAQSEKERDTRLVSSIAVLSSTLYTVSGSYASHRVYPSLLTIFDAPSSAGKGNAAPARHLCDQIHQDLLAQYDQQMARYLAEMDKWEKGEIKEKPVEPSRKLFQIPDNNTKTSLICQIAANDGVGLITGTELDTLGTAARSKFGQFSDVLRSAAHHEPITLQRKTDNLLIEIKNPRIGMCISGTPDQINRFIDNPENGLFSRILFYCLPQDLSWNNPWAPGNLDDINKYFTTLGSDYYYNYYQRLHYLRNDTTFTFTVPQQEEFNAVFSKLKATYYDEEGESFISSVHRMGLTCFRLAMTLSVLRELENGMGIVDEGGSRLIICDDESFRASIILVPKLLKHTCFVFHHLPVSSSNSISPKLQSLLDGLPECFTRQEYHSVAKKLGIEERTSDGQIRQLVKRGYLIHWGQNEYRRT